MKTQTRTKQIEKTQAKRTAILNAALAQITLFGFHGTSIKMIAATAEVATGSIYNHFANKEEVIQALYLQIVTSMYFWPFGGGNFLSFVLSFVDPFV